MKDLEKVFAEFYNDIDNQVQVGLEFQACKSKDHDQWKKPLVWAQCKFMTPWQFWNMHGHCCPLLCCGVSSLEELVIKVNILINQLNDPNVRVSLFEYGGPSVILGLTFRARASE